MIVQSTHSCAETPHDEDGTRGDVCAECGAQIGDDQDTYVYRITDIDGWILYKSICPACAGREDGQ